MYKIIVAKDWQTMCRNRTWLAGCLLLLLMCGIAFTGTLQQDAQLQTQRLAADSLFRAQWDQLRAGNPHDAAHFGTWLYKPLSVLSSFDNGIHHVSGYTMRVEAHIQHMSAAAPVQPADNYLRFGAFTPAAVLQLFFPLVIIFCCYQLYVQEREAGTLKLLLIQGGARGVLVRAKAGLALLLSNGLLLACLLLLLPALFFWRGGITPAISVQALLLTIAYMLYASVIALLCMAASVLQKRSNQALLLLLAGWLFAVVILPRMAAAAGDMLYPLPAQSVIQENISRAEKSGIHGDEPRAQRQQQLEARWLKQYQVKTTAELPVNFDAILMQAAEDYMQRIYEDQTRHIDSIIRLQHSITAYTVLLDPYLAIRELSMALCGADYMHHAHFFAAARRYRNDFIAALNHEMAYGGSKTGDYSWKADATFFKQMPVFRYTPPGTGEILRQQYLAGISLLIWVTAGLLVLGKLSRQESAG
ncbi:DUF3526 domain-containing protein [Chitinophaga sp. Mgbs1]|uniref:DUF3526 domain-containing protein n=1 Tax=Chitinophaga solisilvae TaxID=1233460 RepID=A0A3S1CWM0_9BACT|nr:DUF3526 domain-containing protein [Chitinophaga solisilvae]